MTIYENSVFISYAWGGEREDIVNEIDQSLQARGLKIIRDKRALPYSGSIKEFMERIGRGDCIIIVLSDKYLKSPNCMFELVEIAENKQFINRIFPIVLADADIYNLIKQAQYIKYWEGQIVELKDTIKSLDPTNLQGLYDRLNLYDRIRDNFSRLTSILSDMNALTPELHQQSDFSALYHAIEARMKKNESQADVMSTPEPPSQLNPARKERATFDFSGQTVTTQTVYGGDHNDSRSIHTKTYVEGAQINQTTQGISIQEVFEGLNQLIEKLPAGTDKVIAQSAIQGLETEAKKGDLADERKVQKMFRILVDTAPDAWEVAVSTFINPVAGVALAFQKIAERAKAEKARN